MTTKKPDDDWLEDEPKPKSEKHDPVPPRPTPPDHKSDPKATEEPRPPEGTKPQKSEATGPWGRDLEWYQNAGMLKE